MIKTSLYEEHCKLGAKIVPFAGYLMPVSYNNGITHEYNSVRKHVGMFDVSFGSYGLFNDSLIQ